jgi:flavin reductase (DIM6/NTAB) family NADH-FMN oxidoreductase RutF
MEIDPQTLRRSEAYALLTSFIVPRAIGFVSTRSSSGQTNVAPFSYFTGLGSDPPMVTLGIGNRRDGSEKDTLRLARESGVLCVNLVEESLADKMVQASGDYDAETSEFDAVGLTPADCVRIDCVRVAESRASLECRLVDVHTYGRKAKTNILVAEVVYAVVDDDIVDDTGHRLHPERIAPVARLGGTHYARLGERYTASRPKV